jgi:hypothetical protein
MAASDCGGLGWGGDACFSWGSLQRYVWGWTACASPVYNIYIYSRGCITAAVTLLNLMYD